MKKITQSVLLMVLIFAFQAEARRDQRREGRQQGRIAEGLKSGELNKHEARRLNRGQRRVDRAQEKAMADGEMTAAEKVKIEKMQDVQSKRIYRQKHDDQKQGSVSQPPVEAPAGE
jgi:hypothetical protein